MRESCRHCHFLMKTSRSDNGTEHRFCWSADDRANGAVKSHYSRACYFGVWDCGIEPGLENNFVHVIDVSRKGSCFFMPMNPGMSFPAAKILQERAAQNAALKRSNLYTRIGLWIAALALVANLILGLIGESA